MRKIVPGSWLTFLASLAFALLCGPVAAHADASVTVLGITSTDGDDDYARDLTGALRHEASQVRGWQVSTREVTLAQMSLAHGCGDTPDVECLTEIAGTLQAERLVYGVVRREGVDRFVLVLGVYDAANQRILRVIEESLPRNRTDIDDLRGPARTMITRLAGPEVGEIALTTNRPNATVRIDGHDAGTTDSSGNALLSGVIVGERNVEVVASGYATWRGSVSVSEGNSSDLSADLVALPSSGGGEGPSLNWPAIALLGASAVALGGAVYTWVRIDGIQNDERFVRQRQSTPSGDDACAAVTGSSEVASLCSEAGTMEVLQYVFSGIAAAAGVIGVVLLVLDDGDESSEPQVSIAPSFSPYGASVGATVRF